MATVRGTSGKFVKQTEPEIDSNYSFDDRGPTAEKGLLEKAAPVMALLLVVMAFALGSLWTKVSMLESGTASKGAAPAAAGDTAGAPAKPAGKYATFNDALKAYAKTAGLDANKLVSCVDSGSKKSVVDGFAQVGAENSVSGTPGYFVNGRFLGGAFPYEAFKEIIDRELAGTGSNDYKNYKDTNLLGAGAQGAFKATPVTINTTGAAVRGPAGAKVTIVEFSDFQCPYCQRGFQTMQQVMKDYEGKVKLVFMDLPLLQLHPHAQKAAEAFECARDQDQTKAWTFHDVLFTNQTEWSAI